MTILGELYKQNAGAWVELFTIDATAQGGGLYHFHAGTNGLRQPVVWQGTTFVPFPVQASGFEVSSQKLPRPRLAIANVNGTISALLQEVDLLGAKVIRRRTMVKYLDAVNFPVAQQSTPGVLTFARSTTATYFSAAGVLSTAAVDQPRIDREPGTGVVRGLLVEEQRTNLQPRSEFQSAWNVTRATLTPNAATSPKGDATAASLIETATTGTHTCNYSSGIIPLVAGQAFTYSAYVKVASGSRRLRIASASAININLGATFDFSTGTVTQTQPGCTATIYYIGGGWWRITASQTAANTTGDYIAFGIWSGATNSYAGDGTSGFYLWGVQAEAASAASSYIPTTTTAVTRAADNETATSLSAIGYSATAGGLTVTARAPASLAQAATLLSYNDNTSNNAIRFRMEAGGALKAEVIAGGVTQASLSLGTLTAGTQFRAALSYAANDIRGCLDGGAVQSDTSASIPTVDRAMIGRGASGEWWNSTISRHRYWSRALTSTELQTITSGGAISDLPALDMDTSTGALAVYTLAPSNPTADPNSHLDDETWYVAQKTTENQAIIEFELGSPIDLEGVTIPRRQIVANVCGWRYRGDGCGYAGPPVADVNDQPTSSALLDRCSKRLSGCKLRFGDTAELPFGAFPAAGLIRR